MKTVRVPAAMRPLFQKAEEVVSRYFSRHVSAPEKGMIEVGGDRYLLVRGASLSVEFFSLARDLLGDGREREADDFARNLLFDLAHAIGKADARNFHERMDLTDPIARLSAGPVHFSHTGWAFVDISPESTPVPGPEYWLVYDHPYSFESDAWLRAGRESEFPVCVMNAGYSAGWCEESFGVQLVATEVLCRARGDEACRFVMAPPDRIEERLRVWAKERPGLRKRIDRAMIPDLFARKRAEDELRRAKRDLENRVAERTAELLQSNERLRREIAERERVESSLRQAQKLEAIGRMAGGIAHDFNNLLTVVIGRSVLLQSKLGGDPSVLRDLEQIRVAGDKAARLTRQLLAFSREQVLLRAPVNLNLTASESVRLLGPVLGEKIEVVLDLAKQPPHALADRSQIEQVLFNLVLNARDALPKGGQVRVRTSTCGHAELPADVRLPRGVYARLDVEDDGVGMDEITVARVFDPFFTTKAEGQGTGLGLSTVYGIVKQSGGAVSVRSEPGKGTVFSVFLPLLDASRAEALSALPKLDRRRGDETVLLAEDQPELRAIVRETLASHGYTVLEAPTPREVVSIARRHAGQIHLLVSDVIMPGMDGPEVARAVREARPDVKVLYVSGYAPDGMLEADVPFLSKPFEPGDLLSKVREVLDAKPPKRRRRVRRSGGSRSSRSSRRSRSCSRGPRGSSSRALCSERSRDRTRDRASRG